MKQMTKKDLIEFLKDYPDNTIIKLFNDECVVDAEIEDYVDRNFSDKKAVLIFGGYGDD
jgi:uncharacterized protein YlzI (FlbEa/FlbD family)